MSKKTRPYPGSWRYLLPIHPAAVMPALQAPIEPTTLRHGRKLRVVYTKAEDMWWVVSDRRWASALMALLPVLNDKGEPDPEYCECMELETLKAQAKLIKKGWLSEYQPKLTASQRCLLAAQAWLDWNVIVDAEQSSKRLTQEWWVERYGGSKSQRSTARAVEILRGATSALVELCWQRKIGLAQAVDFIGMCPERHAQRELINKVGRESFAIDLRRGELPLEGMLKTRIDHVLTEHTGVPDTELARVLQGVIDAWNAEQASITKGQAGHASQVHPPQSEGCT